jgi:hypothetical protein
MTSPVLARSSSAGRVYVHPVTGQQVPSVTTIIGALNKPALPRWAAKSAAEYAAKSWDVLSALSTDERVMLIKGAPWKQSGAAADLGSAVHDAIDAWCTDRSMPAWADGVEPYMEQFVGFLTEREPEFVHNEVTVWSHEHGYAGTLDWIARINGVVTLGDTKSGKGVYPETALQLEALRRADVILYPDGREDPMPTVAQLAVLHVRPRSWALIPVTPGPDTFPAFLAAAEITRWTRDVAPLVLGARLRGAS